MVAPPSEVISPTDAAEFAVMLVTAEIEIVGAVLMASFLQQNKIDKSSATKSTGKIENLVFMYVVNYV